MRILSAILLVAVAVCHAQSSNSVPKPPWVSGSKPSTTKPADSSDDTFKVDVKLVNVFVTVTDERGAPVGGLSKDNFQVLEDGTLQKLSVFDKESELPLSIVLDIDTSLSTRRVLPLELNSARRFAQAILRPVDGLAVYGFNEVVDEVVPFTSDLKTIDRGIDHLRLGAATALYDAIYVGAEALEALQRKGIVDAFGFLQAKHIRPRRFEEFGDDVDAQPHRVDIPRCQGKTHAGSNNQKTCA
jgi:hypothetical protein